MKMVKCLPEFEYFYCFLKNRNFISKSRISKDTDYAAFKVIVMLSKDLVWYIRRAGYNWIQSLLPNLFAGLDLNNFVKSSIVC